MTKLNPAQRRFQWRFFPAMAAYVPALLISEHYLRMRYLDGAALTVMAMLPAIPLILVIATLYLYLMEERDEYLRQRNANAMLIGTGLLLATATIWGFLALGGAAKAPPTYLALPFWCVGFAIGQGALALRDRIGGRP